jgi:Flp pilus assembly protein TadD
MGTALTRQGRYQESIPWFEKALIDRNDDADALQGLGVALAVCGRYEEAAGAWQAALSLGVKTYHVHDNLAKVYALMGRRSEARAQRAISRRMQGKARFGLDLVREAWEWLAGG